MNPIQTEAFDIMQNFYRTAHDPLIRCMIRFWGRLDASALERAVNLSVSAVPPLACRFDSKSHGWTESGFSAKDMLHVVMEESADTAEKCLLSTIDFERGPQLKLFLIQGKENDSLCVIISHLVADGAGFKQYLYLLAELYSACAADLQFHTAPLPGDRSLGQLLRDYSFREKCSIYRPKTGKLKQNSSMYPPLEGQKDRPFVVRCILKRELLASVKSFGKKQNASVNDMHLTAFVRALCRWTGARHLEFPCPVDMRKYLKNKDACGVCNMTSNYLCSVDIEENEPFVETLRKISTQMAAQKSSNACLKGPAFLNMLFHLLPYRVIHGLFSKLFTIPVVSYTNLGILDEHRLAFADVPVTDAFLSTAVKYAPYFQVSVSTWGGRFSLCSSYHGTMKDERLICDFLKEMKKELEAAVA